MPICSQQKTQQATILTEHTTKFRSDWALIKHYRSGAEDRQWGAVTTTMELLRIYYALYLVNTKKGCMRRCRCRKARLKCSALCKFYHVKHTRMFHLFILRIPTKTIPLSTRNGLRSFIHLHRESPRISQSQGRRNKCKYNI